MTFRWIALALMFALPNFLQAQNQSCTPSGPITIDADMSDWQVDWMSDSKGKFAYNICNDEKTLYVRLKITDDMTQRKIGLFGLTLSLNPKGKKIGKIGIKFPVPKDLDELKKRRPEGGPQPTPAEVQALKMDLFRNEEVLELVGLAKQNIVSSRVGLMNGIEVIIQPGEKGEVLYEAKIPFKAFAIDRTKVKELGVAFVTGKLVTKSQTNTAPPGGGAGNSGYASRYGMMGGQSGYGGGNMRASLPQWTEWNNPTSLVTSVKLN
jgi:hypothetical protein